MRNALPMRLEDARARIEQGMPVEYQSWLDKLYEAGYYSALRALSDRRQAGEPNLIERITKIRVLLQQYEQALAKDDVREKQENREKLLAAIPSLISQITNRWK